MFRTLLILMLLATPATAATMQLVSAGGASGLNEVRLNHYGLTGAGQAVAIIDSGIAYDHFALSANYAGGFDFAENDSDPYDDAGAHGTHLAGMIAANSERATGVSPGADLIALRVFGDDRHTSFARISDALLWVDEHHGSMGITAIVLAFGTSFNGDSPPPWATLENEFALLDAAGIFISVAAGNNYSTYNEPGLSYPAASFNVTAAMSHDDNGSLSPFTQRHERAIAAPGRFITSTVPDFAGNQNGVADDFASFSGTSMSAAYLAAASVIVREAMELAGIEDINQSTIAAHIHATAGVTEDGYSRLDLDAAIGALLQEGDYNYDGLVDAADYVAWRNAHGDIEGYERWRLHYSATRQTVVAPEPSSVWLTTSIWLLWRRSW